MGEFGRTPKINGSAGRDHWPYCYSVVLAGGGVRGGITFGSSDKLGAYPDTDAVTPADLAATLFWRFGLDPAREIDRPDRPALQARRRPAGHFPLRVIDTARFGSAPLIAAVNDRLERAPVKRGATSFCRLRCLNILALSFWRSSRILRPHSGHRTNLYSIKSFLAKDLRQNSGSVLSIGRISRRKKPADSLKTGKWWRR